MRQTGVVCQPAGFERSPFRSCRLWSELCHLHAKGRRCQSSRRRQHEPHCQPRVTVRRDMMTGALTTLAMEATRKPGYRWWCGGTNGGTRPLFDLRNLASIRVADDLWSGFTPMTSTAWNGNIPGRSFFWCDFCNRTEPCLNKLSRISTTSCTRTQAAPANDRQPHGRGLRMCTH